MKSFNKENVDFFLFDYNKLIGSNPNMDLLSILKRIVECSEELGQKMFIAKGLKGGKETYWIVSTPKNNYYLPNHPKSPDLIQKIKSDENVWFFDGEPLLNGNLPIINQAKYCLVTKQYEIISIV